MSGDKQRFIETSEPGKKLDDGARFVWDEGDLTIIEPGQDEPDTQDDAESEQQKAMRVSLKERGLPDDMIDVVVKAYDESQPRGQPDNAGQWVAEGGGGGGSKASDAAVNAKALEAYAGRIAREPSTVFQNKDGTTTQHDPEGRYYHDKSCESVAAKVVPPQHVMELATIMYAEAKKEAPFRDEEMKKAAEASGGELLGLDFNVKLPPSAARKLFGDMNDQHLTLEEAAAKLNDSIRYTLAFDEEHYTEGTHTALAALAAMGYKVQPPPNKRFKNNWATTNSFEERRNYQGINANLIAPSGRIIEVQFHTRASFEVKDKINHPYYETVRLRGDPAITGEMLDRAEKVMVLNQSLVTRPKGNPHLIAWEWK